MPKLHDTNGEEPEDLTSRSDQRRARKVKEEALTRLARDLAALSERQLEKLSLSEELLDSVFHAQRITSARARERQLRIVRRHLRDTEWTRIRSELDELLVHGSVSRGRQSPEREWVVRLIGEGTSALNELAERHPRLDRKHFRQLIRNAEKANDPARRKRAEDKLASAIRTLLSFG